MIKCDILAKTLDGMLIWEKERGKRNSRNKIEIFIGEWISEKDGIISFWFSCT